MKRIISFILTTCIIISLFSAIGSIGVSAASGDLLFDMDVSDFDKSISGNYGVKGKVGYGEDYDITFYNTSEIASKKEYVNANGDVVEYINFDKKTAAGYNFSVSSAEIAKKSFTAEFWVRTKISPSKTPNLAFFEGYSSPSVAVTDATIQSWQGSIYLDNANGSTALSDTKWQQVVFVRERAETGTGYITKLYVNGVLKSSRNYQSSRVDEENIGTFYISRRTKDTNDNYSPDMIDLASLKIYEGALSADAILAHHNDEVSDYTMGWNVDVDFKNSADKVWGLAKGGDAVLATDSNVPSDGAVTFTNAQSNYNASRDDKGYLTLRYITPSTGSTLRMNANMPTALKCGTYEMEFSAYYPDDTVTNNTIKQAQLRFTGTKDTQQKLIEFGVYNNMPAIEYSSSWKQNDRNSDNEFVVKVIISSATPEDDWTVKIYNVNVSSTDPSSTKTIERSLVGDLNGAEINLWCTPTMGDTYKYTTIKIGHIKANYNPNVISKVKVTNSNGVEVTDFTGLTEINYDADVYGGKANVVVALYDGDALETARVHTFDGTNDMTGTFTNLDIKGKGLLKVFMISKNFDKLIPKCKSFTYGE